MGGMWESVMVLRGDRGGIEPRRWIAGCEYVSINPSVTRSEFIPSELHVRDKFVEFGDSLVQATSRTREVLEVMSDDL